MYKTARFDREGKSGGGSLLYCRSCLIVTPVKEVNETKETESVSIELCLKSQKFLIGCMYRAPTDRAFYDHFSKVINHLWTKRKNIIKLGDFNSDLLSKDSSKESTQAGKNIKRVLKAFDFHNLIDKPTRISESSKTLIDLIVVNDKIRTQIKSSGLEHSNQQFQTINLFTAY